MTSIATMPMASIAMALTRATRRRRVMRLERRADREVERQALEPGCGLERREGRRAGSGLILLRRITDFIARRDRADVVGADAIERRDAIFVRPSIRVVGNAGSPLVR